MNIIYDRIYIPIDNVEKPAELDYRFTYEIEEYNSTRFYKTISRSDARSFYIVPSGSWHKVVDLLRDPSFEDKRMSCPIFATNFNGKLWQNQEVVVNEFLRQPKVEGFIHSRAGSGKTVMACYILHKLKQRFLIIVPTSLLLNQWYERLAAYLPGYKIGRLGDGYDDYNSDCQGLVAIINSIRQPDNIKRFRNEFGAIVMDEAHRLPADTFANTINNLAALHKIGLSANTTRKDNKHVFIEDYLGPNCVVNENPTVFAAKIVVVHTGLPYAFVPQRDNWAKILNSICGDPEYNAKLAYTIQSQVAEGRKIAVLTPRLFQVEELQTLLPNCRLGVITGSTKKKDRDHIIEQVNAGNIDVLLCSKQIFEEGADIQRLDTIHLVAPSNNMEKLEQAIGRVERAMPGKKQPLVYDYWFEAGYKNAFHNQQQNRYNFYTEKGYDISGSFFST